jgi:hypothetical protein
MAATVQVSYTVPVEVVVNFHDDGSAEVSRVVVIDEGVMLDVEQEFIGSSVDPQVQQAAIKVAESVEWPPWEHGF